MALSKEGEEVCEQCSRSVETDRCPLERESALRRRDLLNFSSCANSWPRSRVKSHCSNFFERNVGFLTGLVGTRDNVDLAILFKPPIGTQYGADFCVLQSDQGGSTAYLFEIETSHDRLFIQNGAPSQRLSYALKQTEDWRIWIDRNAIHYGKELIRMAKALPPIGECDDASRGVRLPACEALACQKRKLS